MVWYGMWWGIDEAESQDIGGTRAMEFGSLCSSTRAIGGLGNGRGPDVNHMGWYHLRVRVDRMI